MALGAKLSIHVRSAAAMISLVRAEPGTRRVPVIVGGLPFLLVPDLWKRIGADGSAPSAAGAVELGARLVLGK